eukprot:GHVU01188293.1.p1 GENE.GHVU01188293.1~~GHVU01188293.1.p1  ORF type:complete len:121 (+),score=8.69 GHVU01188293.1:125-487(+)
MEQLQKREAVTYGAGKSSTVNDVAMIPESVTTRAPTESWAPTESAAPPSEVEYAASTSHIPQVGPVRFGPSVRSSCQRLRLLVLRVALPALRVVSCLLEEAAKRRSRRESACASSSPFRF